MDGVFSVEGLRVTVVGAARSGVAAAELLARRGARVTLTEQATAIADADRLAAAGVALERGGHRLETLRRRGSRRAQPGRAARAAVRRGSARARRAGHRRNRAGVALAEGTRDRDHRHEGQVDDDDADRPDARGVRAFGRASAATSACRSARRSTTRRRTRCTSSRSAAFSSRRTDRFHPWIAALLNFSPDHLDRHPTVEAYAAAKARIFGDSRPDGLGGGERRRPGRAGDRGGGPRRSAAWFGFDGVAEGVTVAGDTVVERHGGRRSAARAVSARARAGPPHPERRARGRRRSAGSPAPRRGRSRRRSARSRGLEHAMELAGDVGGVRFVNDSKATNIASAQRSFESVAVGLVAILGGRYKGGDFGDLREAAARARAGRGRDRRSRAAHRGGARGRRCRCDRAASMDDAVQHGVRASRRRAARWCSRRRVRASTCSRLRGARARVQGGGGAARSASAAGGGEQ